MSQSPPCLHKQANHQCGTNARARLDGCRCVSCLAARRAYDQQYKKTQGEFPYDPPTMVDARPVFDHVESLIAQGMGRKRIAEVSGVPHGSLSKLIYGDPKRNMGPSRKVRRTTAESLLATTVDLADGAKVDGSEAQAIVVELVARGWSKSAIARRFNPKAVALQRGRNGVVSAGTVRELRRCLFEPVPSRFHAPSGRWMILASGRQARLVDPTTDGVPDEIEVAHLRRFFQHAKDREQLADALRLTRDRVGPFLFEEVQVG